MVNYAQAKIYKIIDNTNGNVYIGSTCQPTLAKRLVGHRTMFKSWTNGKNKKYVSSFEILKNGDYSILLIEEVVGCKSKDELRARERIHIENNVCVNKIKRVIVSKEERKELLKQYYEDHKEVKLKQQKQYYKNNKGDLLKQKKQYNEDHKEEIKQYYEDHKEDLLKYQKQYNEDHKEEIKQYREDHKEVIKQKRRERYLRDKLAKQTEL